MTATNTENVANQAVLKTVVNGWADAISSIVNPATAAKLDIMMFFRIKLMQMYLIFKANFYLFK